MQMKGTEAPAAGGVWIVLILSFGSDLVVTPPRAAPPDLSAFVRPVFHGMAQHIYDWARGRGYWLKQGDVRPASHLLLDGGKLLVPEESHGALLNAYAATLVAHPARPPCMVELRTPVFRMFMDLDTRFASREAAATALGGALAAAVCRLAEAACPGCPAIVCAADGVKREESRDDGGEPCFKMGFHVVWPDVLVTAGTALALRLRALEALHGVDPGGMGLVGAWDSIIDAVVYKSSGLRMPWSAKGRHDPRVYVPRARLADGALHPLQAPTGVGALRELVRQLSIRTFGAEPTVTVAGSDDAAAAAAGGGDDGGAYVHRSLAAFADVLPALAAALPLEFLGQRFTGLMAAEHCYMLRSTARHCFNLGRAHRTNNVYFVVTRRGVSQRCYCRCETTEGRRFGMCKDFSSDWWPVPAAVTAAFFPEDPSADASPQDAHGSGGGACSTAPASLGAMPSRAAKSYLGFDAMVQRSKPRAPPPAKRRKAAKST